MWLLLGSKIHTSCVFLLIFATHLEQVLTKNVWSTVNNSWGPWEGATACTRTCGGGVERQTRACLTGRRSNKECIGPNSRFQLCNIQNCPEGSRDFKAEQCAKYNQVAFQTHEEWIPYYGNNLDVCALFCSRRNETDRYYKLANRVIDGTPCSLDTYDVCIHGICQPTGCDRILGSGVKEDKCRECGGDGTNCETVEGEIHYDHSNIKKGYNDMLSIPIGAMHIFIKELRPSANHIALRNELGNFYLNGAGKNERSKSFSAAGTVFRYIGNPGNNKELENLNAVGPTNESLVLVLNHKDEDLEIQYEYSKKREVSPLTEPEEPFEETPIHAPILSVKLPGKQGFAWISGSWTSCSKTCGEGFKKRAVQCFDVTRNIKADGSFCSSSSRPESTLPCTNNACEGNYRWRRGEWSACSKTCGGGEQIQTVYCEEISADGKAASIVEKYLCLRSLGKDPQYKRVCMEDIPCGEWAADPWSQCSVTCGLGQQTHRIFCKNLLGDILPFSDCLQNEQPPSEQSCFMESCDRTGCHSRRFGCCPDGVTAAQGPNFSGCLDRQTCKNTRFGCCPDGQSTAHGPDDEGCYYNCALSTHKCCPDGVTFAKGPNYEGCGFSDGDVCKQPQDQSFCTDYVMKWFYNSSSKTCSQYWDGGCRSSGNKFKTEEECISACRGGCSGEKDGGRVCGEYALKWWYDSSSRTCKQFWYGGCGGNKNKYNSEQECLAECQVGSGCEYSTYGCCPDGITAAGDTNKRNCAYVKSCRDSRYGCCPDKVSEATGPNYYGCTCKDSLYGCCQDGITPAQGPGKYGCPNLPCEQSTYSCCPDGVTHAQGPNYHGCERGCRHSTYGCCADDITPARGHNYEGCPGQGCQRSTYGCCPDGVTHARGPNYHGCERGCRHSTYGCCADDITPARGHNYEGCPGQGCQRSTYGCCPDGVTHARGPNYHGCERGCRHSTYGCCEDDITPARGHNYEGCPGQGCQRSTYGCCPDGVTHARGPNYHGCERGCRHSTYGCCEDDITPARGHNYEGCPGQGCQRSTYGCCPDGVTHARGPNYHGCERGCRHSTYGCCADDITPARGHNYEGCPGQGCQRSTYGCCPDGVTHARGPNYHGCERGCRHSTYGCCEDDITPARGHNYEGCPGQGCQRSTYGCCPDGVTHARGPNYHGCERGCRHSTYGCCEDDITPARGHNYEGCPGQGCQRSTYGCCPDGVTHARGPNYHGCERGCRHSTYGCCADDITPARGHNYEGCPGQGCQRSTYGCCPDGVTHARGPNYHGCERGCRHSTYGCCEDDITPARGHNYEGCPGQGCQRSTYGCCPDGVTHARGPNYHGCERGCRHSTYGCCADDITPARGHNYEGCPGQGCQRSTYGCCPDGVTHARGPNYHGCERGCRHSTYGCCEDDITPARGHNYEGCPGHGCQRSTYGCCPDGVTHAEGPNYHGCYEQNCRISTYGCCADSVTSARGPNYEGCPEYRCQESTYGCCPDGVTHAEGPNYHGCYERNCRHSTYGCCADDITPARGPNYEGCLPNGCQGSTYGCCPDGVTYAQGLNYYGCYDQGDCTSLKDSGSCDDYEIRWFYDYNLGKCEQFWYGGCTGNSNNYKTVRDCQIACQGQGRRPGIPKTTALLPVLITNNFKEPAEVCHLAVDRGPCNDDIKYWFYDNQEGGCKQFSFGGCWGNENKFPSKQECESACSSSAVCTMDKSYGTCASELTRWFFDSKQQICLPFTYSGCNGNANNFASKDACVRKCVTTPVVPSANSISADVCHLQNETGPCHQNIKAWFYDRADGVCKQFIYGGCSGNANNFNTEEECYQICNRQDICSMKEHSGSCLGYKPVFYYSPIKKNCVEFIYGGCGGNANNFDTREACLKKCGFMPYFKGGRRFSSATVQLSSNQSICKLSKEPGTCGQQIVVWYFDYKNGACRRFHYTGCNGNKNRFKKKRDCLLACKGKKHDENMVKSTGSALVLGASRPSLDNRVLSIISFPHRPKKTTTSVTPHHDVWKPHFGEQNCRKSPFGCCPDGLTSALDDDYGGCKDPEETSKYKVLLAEPGKHIIMECGNKPFRSKPNIVWYHGNFIIEPGKRFSIHRDGSLEIHSITDEDSGAYFCKKVGDEVKPPVKQYFVQVKVPLTISSPAKIIVKPGENAFLPCQAQGKPQPQVYWTRNNHPVVSSNQYKLFPNGTLIIVNVQPQDQGDYVCVAQNRHSEPAKATLRLLTRDSVIAKIDRHSGYYKEGSTLTLKCFGYGYPVPSLNWLKDGKPLSTGAHIQVQGGLLNVRNVTYDDGGVYTCVASNDDDKAERDTTIHVELKFDEPRECKDKDAIKCRTIVEASLCRHNLFRKHCCVSCKKSNLT